MTEPFYAITNGDARALPIPDRSVQTIVTSVPYWGLRRYVDDAREIGREETLRQWLDRLVACGREWRRVLRDDGTLWLNCGDSYAHDAKGPRSNDRSTLAYPYAWQIDAHPPGMQKSWRNCSGIKRKDLIGLPWRLALALQADGWYLRSAICWVKGLDWTDAEREAQQKIRGALDLVFAKPQPTDDPCPTCDGIGATGRTSGDAWETETLEQWPRRPCVVLDPFAGTGQTGMAALDLGALVILNDLSAEYCDLMHARLSVWPDDLGGAKQGNDRGND